MVPASPPGADPAALRALPPGQLARVLHGLSPSELASLYTRLGPAGLADLLADLAPYHAARLLTKLSREQAADVLTVMDPDDAVDVVEALEPAVAEAILDEMPPGRAQELSELMTHQPNTAGGLMTPSYVALRPDQMASEALAAVREAADRAETIYYVYVVEPGTNRLLGVVTLRALVLSPPSAPVRDVAVRDVVKVRATASREEAAHLLDQYHLIALPVVDAQDRMLGIITADDAADVLLKEAEEDIERLGGSQPLDEPYLRASIGHLFRKRIVWLLLLFIAEAYTGSVLRHFEQTLEAMVALTFFIPLLIGTGGNTGSQTTSTLVGALRTGEVHFGDLFHVVRREAGVALLLGVVMALATYVRAWTLGVGAEVGPVVALTALCIVIWAAVVAAILPLALHRLRIDPAVVSAPLITTLVDGTGLFIYLTIAQILLHLA
jgi:magnesium transporter